MNGTGTYLRAGVKSYGRGSRLRGGAVLVVGGGVHLANANGRYRRATRLAAQRRTGNTASSAPASRSHDFGSGTEVVTTPTTLASSVRVAGRFSEKPLSLEPIPARSITSVTSPSDAGSNET